MAVEKQKKGNQNYEQQQGKNTLDYAHSGFYCFACGITSGYRLLGKYHNYGSVVNMLLVVSVMTCGMMSGLCAAVISPVMAKLIGIGPLWSLIPFIIAGNITLILTWHSIGNRHWGHKHTAQIIALVVAATSKFLILYIGVAQIAVPLLLRLPEPQASVISNMFSIPQLFTALLGGGVALLVLSPLKKAFEGGR